MKKQLFLVGALMSLMVTPLFAADGTGNGSANGTSHKTLVVYFSQTGEQYGVGVITKGNTEIIAELIANKTNADLFHVEPVNAYPFEYKAQTEVATKELKANARPAFKGDVNDFDSYDTVFIGYPIWWGDLPMAMYTFIEKHNWSGKQVIPFCTHAGSGLSGTPGKIKAACKGSAVSEGIAVMGTTAQNDSNRADKEVTQWLKKIGMAK